MSAPSKPLAIIRSIPAMGMYLARRLARDRAPEMAAALAYRTIFSLIPVLVIALVLLKAFFGEQSIRDGFKSLMEFSGLQEIALSGGEMPAEPGTDPKSSGENETAQALSAWIERFVNNAVSRISGLNYGAITLVGAALLVYSAISLLISIEQTFNAVCRAASGRRLGARLTVYWTLLTLGSIALISSFSLTQWYSRQLTELPDWAAWATRPLQLSVTVGITWLLLILAYTRMPNARVRLRPAAAGAFVAAVMWEFLKWGLSWFVQNMTGGQVAIYGALALIPLFVMWVYITWLIVILGLEIACVLQFSGPRVLAGRFGKPGTGMYDPNAALLLLRAVARDFNAGRQPSAPELALRCSMPEEVTEQMIEQLIRAGLLVRLQGDADEAHVTLARPPSAIKLSAALAAVDPLFEQPADEDAVIPALRARQLAAVGEQSLDSLV